MAIMSADIKKAILLGVHYSKIVPFDNEGNEVRIAPVKDMKQKHLDLIESLFDILSDEEKNKIEELGFEEGISRIQEIISIDKLIKFSDIEKSKKLEILEECILEPRFTKEELKQVPTFYADALYDKIIEISEVTEKTKELVSDFRKK